MIFIAFFCGFALSTIIFITAYFIVRELIFKYGKFITRKIENEVNLLDELTKRGAEIVFPDYSEDIFKKEDSNIQDLLKK